MDRLDLVTFFVATGSALFVMVALESVRSPKLVTQELRCGSFMTSSQPPGVPGVTCHAANVG